MFFAINGGGPCKACIGCCADDNFVIGELFTEFFYNSSGCVYLANADCVYPDTFFVGGSPFDIADTIAPALAVALLADHSVNCYWADKHQSD